ncbi:MAG TPA: Ig-like domain-containing protein [Cyclobacteriaceae bacterium]
MKYYKFLCFSLYLLFLLSCAKQSTPTGGPKDSIPPVMVRSYPKQKQLNFKEKKITLEFNEAIQILNPREQLIITPTIGKDYKATANKKEVTIQFQESFKDSTTYTINFREAISDITEKNAAKNLQLAFSTGPYIDSLIIEGNVYDLLKGKEVKEATIALYQSDTFNIFKHKPNYITKSNDRGGFKIENLKPGIYHIYAFEDKNKNIVADSKNENYGFVAKEINLTQNVKNISIPLIHLDARSLKLTSARPYNNYFNIRFGKNLLKYNITSDSSEITSCYGDDHSNIKVFNQLPKGIDSLKIKLYAEDSIGNTLDSSLYVKFNTKKDIQIEKFNMNLLENSVSANKGELRITLSFNKPIKEINFDSLLYIKDSIQIFKFTKEELDWKQEINMLSIRKTIDKRLYIKKEENNLSKEIKKPAPDSKPKKIIENQLLIGKGVFISIDNDSSQQKKEQIKVLREEDTGMLLTSIKTEQKNYITQVLTKDFKVLDYTVSKPDSKFENLIPNSYQLRLVIDKNGNSIWDAGNFFKKEEPEPAIYYTNEKKDQIINLKANWELGPLLIKY